tara:strand:- start:159 stop:1217 length:1059 start_codon:yes stop_codon:yes gene_type:complete
MAYTAVAKASAYFDNITWTGSSSTTTITGMGFKPAIIWLKNYDGTGHPRFNDSTKGIGFNWVPSGNNANDTTNYIASYTADGFTLTGSATDANENTEKYTAACFKANGGTTASNSDGTITSTVQADTTSGVSVVAFTGTGSAATVGHGLGVAPKFILCKNTAIADRGVTLNMSKIYQSDPETDNMQFAANAATLTDQADKWNDTAPTTTVFSIGTSNMVNGSGEAVVAYCFAEVQGFSKIGYYEGNGNATRSAFVYCGFRPKYIMIKKADGAENWFCKQPNLTGYGVGGRMTRTVKYDDNTSSTNCTVDITSTGFRPVTTDTKANGENAVYIYIAFAEMPMVGTNGTVGLAI